MTLIVVGISVVLEYGAAVLALALIRLTGNRAAWLLISTAVFLMAVQRSILFFNAVRHPGSVSLDPARELFALAIAIVMLAGIGFIARLFHNIRQSEEALRMTKFTLDHAGDAVFWFEPSGQVFYVNDTACRLLEYTPKELLALKVTDLDAEITEATWTGRWETAKQGSTTLESRCRTKFGRVIPVEITVDYQVFNDKEYLCELARDISERKAIEAEKNRLESQLRDAQKMEAIGEVARGLGGEFHALLIAIRDQARGLLTQTTPGTMANEAGKTIAKAGERAAELTSQLFGFSGAGRYQTVAVDLNETVRSVILSEGRTIDRSIRLVRHLEAAPSAALGDPGQLRELVEILITHACEAMPSGGKLTISTDIADLDAAFCRDHAGAVPGRYLMLSVADTGEGISQSELKRIFEPSFASVDRSRTPARGLDSAYTIVINHGGYITADSETGEGTTLSVYLPLAEAPGGRLSPAAAGPETEEGAPSALPAGRILLVDDDELSLQSTSNMLGTLGHRVVTASSGQEAVEHYIRFGQDIDLVIMDAHMSDMEGQDCVESLKMLNPHVKAILTVSYGREGGEPRGADGVLCCLQKPLRLNDLAEAVTAALAFDDQDLTTES